MKRVCCKCGKYLGEKPGPKDAVTHGFCDSCLKIYRAEMLVALENIEKAEIENETCCEYGVCI